MNWIKNIFAKQPVREAAQDPVRAAAEAPLGQVIAMPDTERIQRDSMELWADRLRAEGLRTGNNRQIAQAREIRQRWGLPPCND